MTRRRHLVKKSLKSRNKKRKTTYTKRRRFKTSGGVNVPMQEYEMQFIKEAKANYKNINNYLSINSYSGLKIESDSLEKYINKFESDPMYTKTVNILKLFKSRILERLETMPKPPDSEYNSEKSGEELYSLGRHNQ